MSLYVLKTLKMGQWTTLPSPCTPSTLLKLSNGTVAVAGALPKEVLGITQFDSGYNVFPLTESKAYILENLQICNKKLFTLSENTYYYGKCDNRFFYYYFDNKVGRELHKWVNIADLLFECGEFSKEGDKFGVTLKVACTSNSYVKEKVSYYVDRLVMSKASLIV